MERNLSFSTVGNTTRKGLRPINPDRIASDVSFELEKSEGVRPSVAFMPHRFSPTIKRIHTVSNEDMGIAIPKGTIVSAVPVLSEGIYKDGSIADVSGTVISPLTASGHPLGLDVDGAIVYAGTDNPLYGYGKVINAAVIANGGVLSNDAYNQYDIDSERVDTNGALITSATRFSRGANIPVGITHQDVYINREGQYLNASESPFQLFDSVLSDWLIAVPFYAGPGMTCTVSAGTQTMSAAYSACWAQGIAFMYHNAAIVAQGGSIYNIRTIGNYVRSDYNGKFIPQFGMTEALTGAPTAQTVGRIFAIDTKIPSDLIDTVQSYPYNHAGGTNTYGIPLDLYRLVYYVYSGRARTLNYTNIVADFNDGMFGYVWINLHIN